jgi:hypothetical protein
VSPPRYSKASRAEPLLGGESPDIISTPGADPRGEAPPEDAPTAVEDCPSRLHVANLPPSISATVSGQNKFLSTSRSRRSWRFAKWGPLERDGAAQAPGHGAAPHRPCLAKVRWRRKHRNRPIRIERSRLERRIPLRFIKTLPLI